MKDFIKKALIVTVTASVALVSNLGFAQKNIDNIQKIDTGVSAVKVLSSNDYLKKIVLPDNNLDFEGALKSIGDLNKSKFSTITTDYLDGMEKEVLGDYNKNIKAEKPENTMVLPAGTNFTADENTMNSLGATPEQMKMSTVLVDTLNNLYAQGYLKTETAVNIIYEKDVAFNLVDGASVLEDLEGKANDLKEFGHVFEEDIEVFKERVANSESVNEYWMNKKELQDYDVEYKQYKMAENELDSVKKYVKETGKAIKGTEAFLNSKNDMRTPTFVLPEVQSCVLSMTLFKDGSLPIGLNNLIGNETMKTFFVEYVANHEMGHCSFETSKFNGFQTGNAEVDSLLNWAVHSGSQTDFSTNTMRFMHEQFADTFATAIMLKKYGDNPEFKEFIKYMSDYRQVAYSDMHFTSYSMSAFNDPDIKEKVMNASSDELRGIVDNIIQKGVSYSLANNPNTLEFFKADLGKHTVFNGHGVAFETFMSVVLEKQTGNTLNSITGDNFNAELAKLYSEAIDQKLAEDPSYSDRLDLIASKYDPVKVLERLSNGGSYDRETDDGYTDLIDLQQSPEIQEKIIKLTEDRNAKIDAAANLLKQTHDVSQTAENQAPLSIMDKLKKNTELFKAKLSGGDETQVLISHSDAYKEINMNKDALKDKLKKFHEERSERNIEIMKKMNI